MLPEGLCARIDLSTLSPQPVFGWLARTGGMDEQEMLRTFNCGTGMVCVVPSARADEAISVLTEAGETARPIGEIVPSTDGHQVQYSGSLEFSA